MNVDSNVTGEAPRSNSIIVPSGIVCVTGLLRETVVRPAEVTTPLMFVFAATPLTVCLTS